MAFLRWDYALLADQMGAALSEAEAAFELAQAVKGLDALDERALQAILAEGLGRHHQIAREVHYPSSAGRKLSHRPRCDLVMLPAGAPVATVTDEALWLEVKVAAQLSELGGRHAGYTGRWHALVRDLRKMAADVAIAEAALALVIFTESQVILEKDLNTFENLLVREQVLAGFRHVRSFAMGDRIGHKLCAVAVWPTVMRG